MDPDMSSLFEQWPNLTDPAPSQTYSFKYVSDLMSPASGEAKVDSKRGSIVIEAEFSNLDKLWQRVFDLVSVGNLA